MEEQQQVITPVQASNTIQRCAMDLMDYISSLEMRVKELAGQVAEKDAKIEELEGKKK